VFHIFNGADHFGDIWAARRSWRFRYGDHTLSNQGAKVPDLGMLISFWTFVCVLKTIYSLWLDLNGMSLWLKTMYVDVILYGYLSRWCSEKIYMLLAMRKPWNFYIIIGVIMYREQ
jgi:hypothetical protein